MPSYEDRVADVSARRLRIGIVSMVRRLILAAGGVVRPPADTLRPLRDQPSIGLHQPLAVLVKIDQREGRA